MGNSQRLGFLEAVQLTICAAFAVTQLAIAQPTPATFAPPQQDSNTFGTSGTAAAGRVVLPRTPPIPRWPMAPGYCNSVGGSTAYERISNVTLSQTGPDTALLTVQVYIANPQGCTAGNDCPSYDPSPEYVNVWIDWDNNHQWASSERVMNEALTGYKNINYAGTMTTQSIIQIPPGATRPAWLRANLGWGYDPNDPCEVSWAWGNVFDKLVLETLGVVRLEALDDYQIADYSGDTIWAQSLQGATCSSVTPVNLPLCDGFASGSFRIRATLDACPSPPPYTPSVKCKWRVSVPGASDTQGDSSFTGLTGDVSIRVPQAVGKGQVLMTFEVTNPSIGSIVRTQTINRTIYVTYSDPSIVGQAPKIAWLERATGWAQGASTQAQITQKLKDSIYGSSGWIYLDQNPSWVSMVEGSNGTGNCLTFAIVWHKLAQVLGVGTTSLQQVIPPGGFLTTPATALDGKTGNAREVIASAKSRWWFGMHTIGVFSGTYFDPTMGKTYGTSTEFVESIFDHASPSGYSPSGWFLKNGWLVYPEAVAVPGPWGDLVFNKTPPPGPTSGNGSIFVLDSGAATPVDDNADGYFDALEASATLFATEPGTYVIHGVLTENGVIIASRPSFVSMLPTQQILIADAGENPITLRFSGQEIRRAGVDGVYWVELSLSGPDETSDFYVFGTEPQSASSYAEFGAELLSFGEAAPDDNGDGKLDGIAATAQANILRAGVYQISGLLRSGNSVIATAQASMPFDVGAASVPLVFPGQDIFVAGMDGPYVVELSMSDFDGNPISELSGPTAAYQAGSFRTPLVFVAGSTSSVGIDTNGNGKFDILRITAGVNVAAGGAGTYTVTGFLSPLSGLDVASASAVVSLASGTGSVVLEFSGVSINASGQNGPYRLRYVSITDGASGDLVSSKSNAHVTGSYLYDQFESAGLPLVSLTNSYSDSGSDTNGNGLFDSLRVTVGVMPSQNGNIVAQAGLQDANGHLIQTASGIVNLQANQSGDVVLTFEGIRVFGSLSDGPYSLTNLLVYHTGDPSKYVLIPLATTTDAYQFKQFERWGDINQDALVDSNDLSVFMNSYGRSIGQLGYRPEFDWDNDQRITLIDYQKWLACYRSLLP